MNMNKHLSLCIGWLYPTLMSTYGDRGNIISLTKRCEWRGIQVKILPIERETHFKELQSVDLLFGGGAQDREQEIVMRDLKKEKGQIIKNLIEKNTPSLFVCGSPQLMGKYYEPGIGKKIEGLGIFDMISKHPGLNEPRLIGNTVGEIYLKNLAGGFASPFIVGFENHGGRTYLGEKAKPFAKILVGNGNNGQDGTEGVVYKNAIGCYFHGPLLPKNPLLADWLTRTALQIKYQTNITLTKLDDTLEEKAQAAIAGKLGIRL